MKNKNNKRLLAHNEILLYPGSPYTLNPNARCGTLTWTTCPLRNKSPYASKIKRSLQTGFSKWTCLLETNCIHAMRAVTLTNILQTFPVAPHDCGYKCLLRKEAP